MTLTPFHFAIPVDDLASARSFYGALLGCSEGRRADHWVDFDLSGHQVVGHMTGRGGDAGSNAVDRDDVPIPHFGVVLTMPAWRDLAGRLEQAGIEFIIEPHVRFQGQAGEQAIMFFRDPAGNALEFKAFANEAAIETELFCR